MADISNRVVVTGIGAFTPLGLDMPTTWAGLIAGKSGIGYITLFDASGFDTRIAGEVKNFIPTNYIDRKDARHMDRFAQLSVAAGKQAVQAANLQIDDTNRDNVGVIIGSAIGGLTTLYEQIKVLLEKGKDRVSPFLGPMMIVDMASAQVSIALQARGANFSTTSACSSGSDAVGVAYELIKRGDATVMIAGGADALINPIGIAAFNANRAITSRNDPPDQASRPFDAKRDGFVMSEGAACLVLENLDFARKRNAKILAEIIGYGISGDAYHMTQPSENGEGAARAMRMALSKAGLEPNGIDYINAHGTATPLNDKCETRAIKTVFGEHARKVPVSSTKSMLGHLIGAAGAIEAAISVMVICEGIIPPTINLTTPDPECDLDYVPNVARKATVNTVMSNAFGFGGHNSVLIFRKYSEA